MDFITQENIKKIVPLASSKTLAIITPFINVYCEKFDINNKLRFAAFIAQVAHESGSFFYTKEIASGEAYDTGQKAIDLGNTPEKDGDGQKFKGRGYIQITGKFNYTKLSKAFGIDFVKTPELLEQLEYTVASACWFFSVKGLNILADKQEFKKITKTINGGYTHYNERLAFYNRAKQVLNINI